MAGVRPQIEVIILKKSSPTTIYVDGGYLRAVVSEHARRLGVSPPSQLFWGAGAGIPWRHWTSLFEPNRILYYDAPPPQRGSELDVDYELRLEQFRKEMDHLNAKDGVIVRSGYVRGRGKRARQKGVDILLAVEMLNHAAFGNLQEAVLLSGDLDFQPVVDSLVRIGTRVTIFAAHFSVSDELKRSADRFVEFQLKHALEFFPNHDELNARFEYIGFLGPTMSKPPQPLPELLCQFSTMDRRHIMIHRDPMLHSAKPQPHYFLRMLTPGESEYSQKVWRHRDLKHLLQYAAVDSRNEYLLQVAPLIDSQLSM